MVAQIQMRRDSAADWTAANPVLAEGEFGFETDTRKYKIGDGATAWNSLAYAVFDGFTVGRRYQWDSASTADSDPGAGNLRPNNGTIGSVTTLFFDNADYAGGTATAFLDGLDDGGETGNRGILFIQSASDPDVYVEFQVTGSVVDGTGYRKVSVTYLTHVGTIADDDVVVISFQAVGPASAGDFKADGSVDMAGDFVPDGDGTRDIGNSTDRFAEIHVDTVLTDLLRGATTAGSLPVQGEGTATTNLQQGLAKAWAVFNGTGTPALRDSFNAASIVDNGTGNYAIFFITNMGNANFAQTNGGLHATGNPPYIISENALNPNAANYWTMTLVTPAGVHADLNKVTSVITGDLA